jgi:hypothetical protein
MLEAIIKRLKHDRRGVSNVIVVMLSLILIVVIVANVVLWSYQMNKLDWERIKEKIEITNVESGESFSSWFVAETEYAIETGSRVDGSYVDTHSAEDGFWETFQEELSSAPPRYRLFINGTFILNIGSYPLNIIQTVEILLKYNASDTGEKWYLKAYNWTEQGYSDSGFNDTSGSQPSVPGAWVYYRVNLTNCWRSYVRDDGVMYIQFHDETPEPLSGTRTQISIDFLGVRVVGNWVSFTFNNKGPSTVHVVSLWIITSNSHRRYDADFFINSGENEEYVRADISLPTESFLVKIVTERGNIAVFTVNN